VLKESRAVENSGSQIACGRRFPFAAKLMVEKRSYTIALEGVWVCLLPHRGCESPTALCSIEFHPLSGKRSIGPGCAKIDRWLARRITSMVEIADANWVLDVCEWNMLFSPYNVDSCM